MADTSLLWIIDDDPSYPKIMEEALRLEKIQAELIWFENGAAALSSLQEKIKARNFEKLPSFIFLDINMPGMNGFEVLQKLKENQSFRLLPVFMLSVSQSAQDVERSYQNGAAAYLSKPSDFGQLREMLRAVCNFWLQHARLPAPWLNPSS
jgi:CheY-like chemotaxis protein